MAKFGILRRAQANRRLERREKFRRRKQQLNQAPAYGFKLRRERDKILRAARKKRVASSSLVRLVAMPAIGDLR